MVALRLDSFFYQLDLLSEDQGHLGLGEGLVEVVGDASVKASWMAVGVGTCLVVLI